MKNVPFGIQLYTMAMYEVEFVEKELKKLKLDKHQFLYLVIPSVFPGIVQSEIAHYFNVNKSTAGRMIIKLVDKGYLRRSKAKNDRDFNVYLTEKGEMFKETIFESVQHYEDIMLGGLEDREKFKTEFSNTFDTTRKARKVKGKGKLWENLVKTR
jgi:DNA-binding MarR family transcriptional regulator